MATLETQSLITPESLMDDNHSQLAKDRRSEWNNARDEQDLVVYGACSDARTIIPWRNSIIIRSIATGGERTPYYKLLNDERVRGIVVVTHYAGKGTLEGIDIEPGVAPSGCGGLGAKESLQKNHSHPKENGIYRYIEEEVWHPDVTIQALTAASKTSRVTDKHVLAVTQNHITGLLKPIGFYSETDALKSAAQLEYLFHGQYNPEEIYKNGIPTLSRRDLPQVYGDVIEENKKHIIGLKRNYPDLYDAQKVQNPRAVVLTTNIKPLAVSYPNIFGKPGSAFQLSLPRIDMDYEVIPKDLESALNQAEYPITHSLEHYGLENAAFADLDTIYIETGVRKLSRKLAEELVNGYPWMKEWLAKPGKQVLYGEIVAGSTQSISKYV